jgi:hypothetical protein
LEDIKKVYKETSDQKLQDMQKLNNEIAVVTPSLSVIAGNVNGVNSLIKRQIDRMGKNKQKHTMFNLQ